MYKEEKEVTVYTGPNNTKYEKIGTIYVSEGMTVFNKIENGHEYVEYGTKVGLKRGYVPISTLTNVENVYVPTISGAGIEKIVYGTSEKNQDLVAYKLGNGSKILISVFAIHGFEDAWAADGVELSRMAIKVTQDLATYKSANGGLNGWTVYIIPAANPDGITYGYTNDGPGRCTIESQTDMNRSFPERFSAFTSGSRNYTGETKLGSKEAKSLYNFIESKSPDVFLDIHGWENKTLGNAEIGRYFEEQFGFGHTDAFQEGGIADWAKTLKNKTTKSALIELPMPSSPQDIANRGFGQKVSNAISNIVKKGATASTNGWVQIDNKWYYHENGDMIKGWKQLGDTWYYMDESGVMQTGWQSIGGVWYYLKSDGAMQTGWLRDNDNTYYLTASGAMATGSQTIDGTVYEFNGSGALIEGSYTGWVPTETKWYYYENGNITTGWKQLGDIWYYMDENGIMQTGWLRDNGNTYYLTASGAMATGWQDIGGNKYYFESSGAMAKNVTMDGYEINGEGIAKKKEEDLPSNIFETITMDINGQKINFSWQKVKGKYFLFPATRRDMEKYHHAYAISFSPKELVSMIIGITPADAYKDTIDFIYGKDIITGEKLNRGLLLTMIITPEIIDVMFKKGVKNADELKNLFKNGSKGAAEATEQLIKGFWNMDEAGSIINGRRYSKHALERMAPNTSEVRAELYKRATNIAKSKGLEPTTKEYSDFVNKYVDPRNIPPMVIEDAVKNTTAIPGNTAGTFLHEAESVKVVVNQNGDVITVIPK